jgi:hypothetical protein
MIKDEKHLFNKAFLLFFQEQFYNYGINYF